MPLYEYECAACHHHTEKIQKFSDTEITVCPHCGGRLERIVSAPAVFFKGGGWFADGYSHTKSETSGKSNPSAVSMHSTDSASAVATSTPAAAAPAVAASSSSDTK